MQGIPISSGSALSVAANAESANQVQSTYDYLGVGKIILYARASATGLLANLFINGQQIARRIAIPFTGTAGGLDTSAHMILQANTAGGRAEVTFTNTTGAAITVDFVVSYLGIPLGRGIARLLGR